jgi:hypothetical protein
MTKLNDGEKRRIFMMVMRCMYPMSFQAEDAETFYGHQFRLPSIKNQWSPLFQLIEAAMPDLISQPMPMAQELYPQRLNGSQIERLVVTSEENMREVIQDAFKILRRGYESVGPTLPREDQVSK